MPIEYTIDAARRLVLTLAGLSLLAAASTPSPAQGVAANAISVSADNKLMGAPLTGGAARVTVSIDSTWLVGRLGVERVTGRARRTGQPCGTTLLPGPCAVEPLSDYTEMNGLTGGVGIRVIRWWQFTVGLTLDLRVASVKAETRGLVSDQRLYASSTLWGGQIGFEGSWFPWQGVPFALQAGASIDALMVPSRTSFSTAYAPFDDGITSMRYQVGLSWRPWSR